jgi:DNA-binding NtrC family response regulator
MTYKKKKKIYGTKKNYSVVNKLLKEEKVTDRFLSQLNDLSLEEIIAVKLEIAAKASGGNIFGMPIWNSLRDICRDASLKFAISAARTKAEAANFLGISISTLKDYMKKYETKEYFEETDETNT